MSSKILRALLLIFLLTSLLPQGQPVRAAPPLPPGRTVGQLSAGVRHTLARLSDGTLLGWGDNGAGQCDVPAPNAGFVAIAAGGWSSLGIKAVAAAPGCSPSLAVTNAATAFVFAAEIAHNHSCPILHRFTLLCRRW